MFFENSSSDKQTLVRLVKYFAPHKVMLLIAIVGLLGFSIVDAGMIYFIQPLIDEGLAKSDGNVLKLLLIHISRCRRTFCLMLP